MKRTTTEDLMEGIVILLAGMATSVVIACAAFLAIMIARS